MGGVGRERGREEKEEVGEVAVCRLSLPAEPGSLEQKPSIPHPPHQGPDQIRLGGVC